jgi:Tol biopolymer transport system component
MPRIKICFIIILFASPAAQDVGKKQSSPIDDLPPYITKLTNFGQRADWSPDGNRLLFIEKTFGDVYEVDLATKIIRPLTHHYFHEGYTRALYLKSGDILLSGARDFEAEDPWPSRDEENAELWILQKDLFAAPVPLGEHCSEGPAVSRTQMKIIWTFGNAFYRADVIYKDKSPQLYNKKKILDAKDLDFECFLESQNFRPPHENELIFSAYEYQGSEVMGFNLETGEVVNYTNAPDSYEEPEGIFPDGEFTTVEGDKHYPEGIHFIDIYKLALDGSGRMERLTRFADYKGFKATNPVIRDDGKYMAFQYAKEGDPAGVGRGILIMDLEMYESMKNK